MWLCVCVCVLCIYILYIFLISLFIIIISSFVDVLAAGAALGRAGNWQGLVNYLDNGEFKAQLGQVRQLILLLFC